MRICIVTIYNGINYGSFWQAYAMRTILESMGHQVCFLKTGARNPVRMNQMRMLRRLLTFQWRKEGFQFQIKSGKSFETAAKRFAECEMDSETWDRQDCILFGSDEIWNIRRRDIYRFPVLFGHGMNDKKKVSYAVSVNASEPEDFQKHIFALNSLNTFRTITVRDEHSKKTLEKCLHRKDISVVLDPTMLLSRTDYEKISRPPDLAPFILIYSYGDKLTSETIQNIRRYADRKKKKLVSVLNYFSWCDCHIPGTPEEILGLFQNADAVFTDTFHGAVFSILYEKEFAVISKPANKLEYLLKKFNLDNRIAENGQAEQILKQKIPYAAYRQILEKQRRASIEQLKTMIET